MFFVKGFKNCYFKYHPSNSSNLNLFNKATSKLYLVFTFITRYLAKELNNQHH